MRRLSSRPVVHHRAGAVPVAAPHRIRSALRYRRIVSAPVENWRSPTASIALPGCVGSGPTTRWTSPPKVAVRPMKRVTSKVSGTAMTRRSWGGISGCSCCGRSSKPTSGTRKAQGLSEPFGGHGAVAPFAGAGDHRRLRRGTFVAEHDRNEASGETGQIVSDGTGIERGREFRCDKGGSTPRSRRY